MPSVEFPRHPITPLSWLSTPSRHSYDNQPRPKTAGALPFRAVQRGGCGCQSTAKLSFLSQLAPFVELP